MQYSGTIMNREPIPRRQHHLQHEQELELEQEPHPYMSLYEPVLLQTGPEAVKVDADACLSSSSSSSSSFSSSQQQQQPEEVTVSELSPSPSPSKSPRSRSRINDTTSSIDIDIDRAKKRQKITIASATPAPSAKIDYRYSDSDSDDNVAENDDQWTVTSAKNVDKDNVNDDDDASIFYSSDDEAIIERVKLVATKKKQKLNSKRQSEVTATGTTTTTIRGIGEESNKICSNSGNNDTIRTINTDKHDAKWIKMYQRLVAYKKEHNDTYVPRRYKEDPLFKLGNWVDKQRSVNRKKKMTEERKRLLNSTGFVWDADDAAWEEMYQRLVAYNKEHTDTRITRRYKEDPQLGRWDNRQRAAYKEKSIKEERKRILNSIGFVWDGKASRNSIVAWMKMYQRLVAYKKEHENTKVPQGYKEDPQLASWVGNQRTAIRKKKMTEERTHLLNSIGFVWVAKARGASTATWEEMFQRLVAYKKEHNNDTNVPQSYKEDPPLGVWVGNQRTAMRKKKMTEERRHLFNSIGFVWDASARRTSSATWEEMWEEMYQRLVAYKKEHNDTNVPQSYKEDSLKLGRWVNSQRTAIRKKKMTEERRHLLNSIGFIR